MNILLFLFMKKVKVKLKLLNKLGKKEKKIYLNIEKKILKMNKKSIN